MLKFDPREFAAFNQMEKLMWEEAREWILNTGKPTPVICPSCKQIPLVSKTAHGTQWHVICVNPNCQMEIKTAPRWTREAAIRLWNRSVGDKKAA